MSNPPPNQSAKRSAMKDSGITEVFQRMETLFAGTQFGLSFFYEEVWLKNKGNAILYLAQTTANFAGTPTSADSLPLDPGDELDLTELDLRYSYLATADDGEANVLIITGRPAYHA